MARKKEYTGSDIQVLTDQEHVRLRTQIYLGNTHPTEYDIPIFEDGQFRVEEVTFIPAVYKAIGEILDNSVDEFAHINIKNKLLTINANPLLGEYTISDNGRGIPIDKHETGKFTPEVALGSLRSGRNFSDEKEAGVIGQNGVGSACTNFCSLDFQVRINRNNKLYTQKFSNGASKVSKPSIRKGPAKTGTEITFTLDPEVFSDITLPEQLMRNRAIEIAMTNPGVGVAYNKQKFKYNKGMEEIVKQVANGNILEKGSYFKFQTDTMEFYVVIGVNQNTDEQMFTWVNSSLLFDGGLCNTQFMNAFVDRAIKHLQPQAKKEKAEVIKNDIRAQLLVFGNLRITNPEYDAQSKTRLTGPNLRLDMQKMVDGAWRSFARQQKGWLDVVLERALLRHHSKANAKAIKDHAKGLKKKVAGLVDATHKNRALTQVLITEGLSAASMITEAREPRTTASFPLTGKINNVYGATHAQLLKMGKITNLLSAIGLVPGRKALRSELRFGKIVIATDADVDGSDIFTLLVNLFFQWPELFDENYEPIVYRLVAPNVCLVKGKDRVHFANRAEYEKEKGKYRGYEVRYYKGLGSMVKEDWEMILSGETDTLIPVTDDGKMSETLKLLFGPDSDVRKRWLQDD
jgi:DNA gyrase/topoisomerase IV subunit B